jgi:predicted dehydrogenase
MAVGQQDKKGGTGSASRHLKEGMRMRDVTVAMVALGGYGNFYLEAILDEGEVHGIRLVAGVDPNPVRCRYLDRLEAANVPIFPDLESFYRVMTADLVVIAAPIPLHLPFTRTVLVHGSSVLCEKPAAATVQEVRAMVEAEAEADGFVGIGYQWSYSEAIQALKRDVMVGTLGAPVRMRTKVLWPRPLSYYGRSSWAARIKTDAGDWVLDSPVMNATAHYLHNCFYVLGETRESSTMPMDVEAELYRANEIENYDTAAIRCHTESGVEILYYAAHPVSETIGPVLRYEFEDAVVSYEGPGDSIVATFDDGRIVDYGDPFANNRRKLWQAADAVRTGTPMACGITTASAHTLCTNGAQESGWPIVDFPEERLQRQPIREGEDTLVWVEGLQETLERAYDGGSLPSELGAVDWARLGDRLSLEGYTRFPSVIELD